MVLHTLLIYLTVHSEGSTVCACAGKNAYHFRHIVEMFWAPMHGAQVLKVWALQNGWKSCILWHSSRKTNPRLRSGCTEQGYITTAMIEFITKYPILICLTQYYWIFNSIDCQLLDLSWMHRKHMEGLQMTDIRLINYSEFHSWFGAVHKGPD
jgi:hypothetical protein